MNDINLGLPGTEEYLALKTLAAEQDDDGCTEDEDLSRYNEADALDDARGGAGYESEWAEF